MDAELRGFVKMYLFVVAVFGALSIALAAILRQDLLSVVQVVFFWVGVGYMAAATFAWTGFANLYRYSPTLFLGSPSYRRQIIKGQLWKEGRDNGAFVVGLAFGLALLGLDLALTFPIFVLVDLGIVALALVARHSLQVRVSAKT